MNHLQRTGSSLVATAVAGSLFLGIAPTAQAAEAPLARQAQVGTAASLSPGSTDASPEVPPIVEAGLDARLAALPADRDLADVLEAMYPGDPAAQQAVAAAIADGSEIAFFSFWGTAWKYTKCVAAVGAAFIPASKAYKAIKGLGGVAKAARLLLGAGSRADFLKVAGNSALDILGISAIQSNCF